MGKSSGGKSYFNVLAKLHFSSFVLYRWFIHNHQITKACQNSLQSIRTCKSERKFKRKSKRVCQNSLQITLNVEKVKIIFLLKLNEKFASFVLANETIAELNVIGFTCYIKYIKSVEFSIK